MLERIRTRVPPALLGAMFMMVVVVSAQTIYGTTLAGHAGGPPDGWHGFLLARAANALTVGILFAVGLADLKRRLTGPDRTLALVAATTVAVMVARQLLNIYFQYASPPSSAWLRDYYHWSQRLWALGWLVAAASLAAAVARRGTVGQIAAAALVVTTAVAFPFETVAEVVYADSRPGGSWLNVGLQFAYAAGLAAALGTTAYLLSPAQEDAAPAGWPDGQPPQIVPLERIGTALVARIVILIGVVVFTLMAVGGKSLGVLKVVVVVGPLGVAVTGYAMVTGMYALGRIAPGPRLRLVGAAMLTTWAIVAVAIQSIVAYRLAFGDSDRRSNLLATVGAWPNLIPLVGLAGLLLLLSGVARIRRDHGVDDGAPALAGAWLVSGTVAALLLQRYGLAKASGAGELVVMSVVVATANVAAILAVARLCHKTAWALAADDGPGLAPARVVDGNQM